jgi:hypothetical protein
MESGAHGAASSANIIGTVLSAVPGPGELAIVLAHAGVGKTACLTHIALEYLLAGSPVLHVAIGEQPDGIRTWYRELLKSRLAASTAGDAARWQKRIEPLRFILTFAANAFDMDKLALSYHNLTEEARFSPALIILDGFDLERETRVTLEELKRFAAQGGVPLWMAARMHSQEAVVNARGVPYPCHETDDLFRAILLLESTPEAIRLVVIKDGDRYRPGHPPLFLNPQTFLLQ